MSAYCPCEKCCAGSADGITASGLRALQGKTIAADPRVWPMGSCVEIEDVGRRVVEDVGGAIKGLMLDVYYVDHGEAVRFGRRALRVRRCQ